LKHKFTNPNQDSQNLKRSVITKAQKRKSRFGFVVFQIRHPVKLEPETQFLKT